MPFSFNGAFQNLKDRFDDDDEDPSYEERATNMIPATVTMLSGCKDCQTSADVYDVKSFGLPDPAGKAGGACTSALLKLLYHEEQVPDDDLTYVEVLNGMRDNLDNDYTQVPQLSSSRPFDLETPFVFAEGIGTRRALLIGINYGGQNGELSGCHNDVINIKGYIEKVHGFSEDNMTILMDDAEHEEPTRKNILKGFAELVKSCEAGDSVFVHYSGHGGSIKDDDSGEEEDGMDECLCPVDYALNGVIRDDDVYSTLVAGMPGGARVTCLMDCCHSGSILDLPYLYTAGSEECCLKENEKFKFGKLFQLLGNLAEDFLDLF